MASSQTVNTLSHGSIAVVRFSKDRIIAAADSRSVDPINPLAQATACKIIALTDKGFFLNIGILSAKGFFDGNDLARKSYRKFRTHSRGTANEWGEQTATALTAFFGKENFPITEQTRATGIFGFVTTGHLSLYRVDVVPIQQEKTVRFVFHVVPEYPNDREDMFGSEVSVPLMNEFAANKTARAHVANNEFEKYAGTRPDTNFEPLFMRAQLQAAVRWSRSNDIAEPIDVLVLDQPSGHIVWVERKHDQCDKDDYWPATRHLKH
jgi:hypothetical protein